MEKRKEYLILVATMMSFATLVAQKKEIIYDEAADGKRIHTQDNGLPEEGKSYHREKVFSFFRNWTVQAVDPDLVR